MKFEGKCRVGADFSDISFQKFKKFAVYDLNVQFMEVFFLFCYNFN